MDEQIEEKIEEIKKFDKFAIVKGITKMVVRHSVSSVVVAVVHNLCPATSKRQKLELYIGAYAMGAVASDKAVDWAGHRVDEYVDTMKKLVSIIKNSEESSEKKPVEETQS